MLHVKCSDEARDHLVMHFDVAQELWLFVFSYVLGEFGDAKASCGCTLWMEELIGKMEAPLIGIWFPYVKCG